MGELGGGIVEYGVGLFHCLAWVVDEGVQGLLEAQGELVPFALREQFRDRPAIRAVGAGAGITRGVGGFGAGCLRGAPNRGIRTCGLGLPCVFGVVGHQVLLPFA
ncbi:MULTISPECIES: hypothetical protein [Streptomyces]|uniref:Uncharacterized protein n=1 Tax=Streptomyces lutosisoli TaxID=2665721 RepID=A0ABW2VR29_9ACTN